MVSIMQHITIILKQFERDNNIKIVFASICGSRDFGYELRSSDYDIWFIYTGEKPDVTSYRGQYKGVNISLSGRHIDQVDISLEEGNSYYWNMLNAKKILVNFRKFKENILNRIPFNVEKYVIDTYGHALKRYMAEIIGCDRNHAKGYRSVLNLLMRINWVEEHGNLNCPLFRNTVKTPEEKFIMSTNEKIDRQPQLDIYIMKELQAVKERYDLL